MSTSEPLAHLYDLALRVLDDQQHRADALRGRLGPVLAATALGTTLLSEPLAGGSPPDGVVGRLTFVLTISGLVATIAGALLILGSRHTVGIEIVPSHLEQELRRDGSLNDSGAFYSEMIARLDRQSMRNLATLDALQARFTWMLCGIQAMLCGLALGSIVR